MPTLIAISFVVIAIVAIIFALGMLAGAYRERTRTLTWLRAVAVDAYNERHVKPQYMAELPGYQAVFHRYQAHITT